MNAQNCIPCLTTSTTTVPFTYELHSPSQLPHSEFCQRLSALFEVGNTDETSVIVEMCRFQLKGEACKFHPHCKYAHTYSDILPVERRKDYFKVRTCKTFEKHCQCKYGTRCQFIHDEFMWVLNDDLSVYFSQHENTFRVALSIAENKILVISYGIPDDESTITDEKLKMYLPLLRSLDNYAERVDPAERFACHLNELAKKQTACQVETLEQAGAESQTTAELASAMALRFEAGNQTVCTNTGSQSPPPFLESAPMLSTSFPTFFNPQVFPSELYTQPQQLPAQKPQQQQQQPPQMAGTFPQFYSQTQSNSPATPPQAMYHTPGYPVMGLTDSAAKLPYPTPQNAWYPSNSPMMPSMAATTPSMMIPQPFYSVPGSYPTTDMFMTPPIPNSSPIMSNGSPMMNMEPRAYPSVHQQVNVAQQQVTNQHDYSSVLSSPSPGTIPASYAETQLRMANYGSYQEVPNNTLSPTWSTNSLPQPFTNNYDAASVCSSQGSNMYNFSSDDYSTYSPSALTSPSSGTTASQVRSPPGFLAEPQFSPSPAATGSAAATPGETYCHTNNIQSLVQVNRRQHNQQFGSEGMNNNNNNASPELQIANLLPLQPVNETNMPQTPEYTKNCALVQTPPNKHKNALGMMQLGDFPNKFGEDVETQPPSLLLA